MTPLPGSPYRLRFFFDAGSGACLWAGNDLAREKYGYALDDLNVLPLSADTQATAANIIARYDTGLNWDNPAGPGRWTPAQAQEFQTAADALLQQLQTELGETFDVMDARS